MLHVKMWIIQKKLLAVLLLKFITINCKFYFFDYYSIELIDNTRIFYCTLEINILNKRMKDISKNIPEYTYRKIFLLFLQYYFFLKESHFCWYVSSDFNGADHS